VWVVPLQEQDQAVDHRVPTGGEVRTGAHLAGREDVRRCALPQPQDRAVRGRLDLEGDLRADGAPLDDEPSAEQDMLVQLALVMWATGGLFGAGSVGVAVTVVVPVAFFGSVTVSVTVVLPPPAKVCDGVAVVPWAEPSPQFQS